MNGDIRAYLLTPVPEPSSLALAGLGFVALVALHARRADGTQRR